ncbi:hypothetical protein G7Y89_g13916 [Cudoniella acicularis]|uniref:lysine--tRNA ligase n=1 Tax=Cudoniella acicularis TaxID=354080 RepID=A0A8H4R6C1_9HELO|nr:hypothetical protein G7Y89_g13916 [Cudoniella acicularis]
MHLSFIVLAGLAANCRAASLAITVGKDGDLAFSPNSSTAAMGDTLEFHFFAGGHSVVSSTFNSPCIPSSNAFYSGYIPGGSAGNDTFIVNVNSTDPIWFYCSLNDHCKAGMVGVVNPPSGESISDYAAAAAQVAKASAPLVPEGGVITVIDDSTKTTAAATKASSVKSGSATATVTSGNGASTTSPSTSSSTSTAVISATTTKSDGGRQGEVSFALGLSIVVEADEKELKPNQYFEIRSRNINKLRTTKNPNPYPHKFHENYDLRKFVAEYGFLKSVEHKKDVEIRLGGRIYNKCASGNKLVFYDIRTEGVKVQVMCQVQEAKEGGAPFAEQHEHLQRGDIIGIVGYPGRTAPNKIEKSEEGELSIFATEIVLLTPCLHQLPDEYYWFKDQERRHRKRYLDLITNDHTRNVFLTRSKMVTYIRKYFDDQDFVEVETPMMNPIAGEQ